MSLENITALQSAERVLIPSGRDCGPCAAAVMEALDIEVPDFPGRQLVVVAGGRKFAKVKGKDIPELIAAGMADIGVTGTDVCMEYIDPDTDNTAYAAIGPPMCRYDLLAANGNAGIVRRQLRAGGDPVAAATGLPRLLGKLASEQNLNVTAAPLALSGSIEAALSMGWANAAADIVQTGTTAEANGLARVATLAEIAPSIVWRDTSKRYVPALSVAAICPIDATLDRRSCQIGDLTVDSYTLDLLRNPNEAVKKFGSEAGEVLQAAIESPAAECESEIADLVYAAMVLVRSRRKNVRLENILRELAGRNQSPKQYQAPSSYMMNPRR